MVDLFSKGEKDKQKFWLESVHDGVGGAATSELPTTKHIMLFAGKRVLEEVRVSRLQSVFKTDCSRRCKDRLQCPSDKKRKIF